MQRWIIVSNYFKGLYSEFREQTYLPPNNPAPSMLDFSAVVNQMLYSS